MARGGVEGPILDLGIWEFGNLGIWDLGSSETLGLPSALERWGGGGAIPKFPNSQIPKFPNSPNSQIPKSRIGPSRGGSRAQSWIWEFGNLGIWEFGIRGDRVLQNTTERSMPTPGVGRGVPGAVVTSRPARAHTEPGNRWELLSQVHADPGNR